LSSNFESKIENEPKNHKFPVIIQKVQTFPKVLKFSKWPKRNFEKYQI
jgi:hypothetical protein